MLRRTPLVAATLLALAGTLIPADAAAPKPAPSRYGTTRGFEVLAQVGVGGRGNNSPVAVAGRCVYVGDRGDQYGIAIFDAANPRKPKQVGLIKPVPRLTQREMRADDALDLLVVENLGTAGGFVGNIEIYDIRNCAKPVKLATYDTSPRPPHEFFLWRDPKRPGRVLLYVTFTLFSPDLEVLDITDPRAPKLVAAYDIGVDIAQRPQAAPSSGSGYLHSISVSDDGTRAYMGTWDFGMYVADTSDLANALPLAVIRPVGLPVEYDGNVHGGVKVPGRPYVVMVEEGYANAGDGCPFGWLRMADITDPTLPKLAGEFKLQENDCDRATALNGTFTAHNQTVFPNVALVPWYGGGLRAVDISNPKQPVEAGVFVPKPRFDPEQRDNRLYFPGAEADPWTGAMWSYPVVQNGLIYVVDIDLGLFILRYKGKHAAEVSRARFVEGNSAPSRYSAKDPVIRRPKAIPAGPATYTRWVWSLRAVGRAPEKPYGFFCVTR